MGKLLVLLGIVLCAVGAALWLLPGDIRVGNSFYFPLATCVVVSLVLTLLVNLVLRLLR
jgi:Protein of unknown function (DUF2905)